jgi:hypothetical protein
MPQAWPLSVAALVRLLLAAAAVAADVANVAAQQWPMLLRSCGCQMLLCVCCTLLRSCCCGLLVQQLLQQLHKHLRRLRTTHAVPAGNNT